MGVRAAAVILPLAVSMLVGCAHNPPPSATPAPKPPPPCLSQVDDLPFATCLLTELDQVWTRELRDTGRTYTAPRLTVGDGARGDRTRDGGPDRAFYSPRSGIHLPTRYLMAVHTAYGPRAQMNLTFTMSHEIGHHIQSLLHPGIDVRVNDREAQADCYSGVWAHQEAADGKLDSDQFRAAAAAELNRLSTYPDEVATHGDPAQRLASLDKGLHNGDPAACDVGPLTWR
jgi:predicted metalloprotease